MTTEVRAVALRVMAATNRGDGPGKWGNGRAQLK
jgi:hypothetical protein